MVRPSADRSIEPGDGGAVRLKSWKGDYLHRPDQPQGVTTWNTGIGNEWTIEHVRQATETGTKSAEQQAAKQTQGSDQPTAPAPANVPVSAPEQEKEKYLCTGLEDYGVWLKWRETAPKKPLPPGETFRRGRIWS